MRQLIDCEQGTPEWFKARSGIVTCSELKNVITAKEDARTRKTYLYKLVGEIITGQPSDGFSNIHTERGHEHEPVARELYEMESVSIVKQAGFIRFDQEEWTLGYSPDGLIGEDGLLEIKSKLPHLHAEILDTNKVPACHMAQIQGGLLAAGRAWCDFVSYCPGMRLFVQRVEADEKKQSQIKDALRVFYKDMASVLQRVAGHAHI